MRYICLAVLLLYACTPAQDFPVEPGTIQVVVSQGTQYNGQDFQIGVVSVSEDSAVLAVRTDELGAKNFEIKEGESIQYGQHTIKVLDARKSLIPSLRPGQPSGSVKLQIQ